MQMTVQFKIGETGHSIELNASTSPTEFEVKKLIAEYLGVPSARYAKDGPHPLLEQQVEDRLKSAGVTDIKFF